MDKIHFVRLDKTGDYHEFSLIHYISIKSFAKYHPEATIYIHINRKFFSKWYTQLKIELGDRLVEVMHNIKNWDKYDCVAHVCDALKINILCNEGGLVVDTDQIALRSYDDILDYDFPVNICEEHDPVSHHLVQLAIGIIYGHKCQFLLDWKKAYDHYEHNKGWTFYSGKTPWDMWKSGKYDDQVALISESFLDPVSYTRDGLADLFLHNRNLPLTYSLHVAESVVWDRYLKPLDIEHIMTVDTTFTKAVRPIVEHLWDKATNRPLLW